MVSRDLLCRIAAAIGDACSATDPVCWRLRTSLMVASLAGDKNQSLLNTRQAAEILNVSEVSIRRWTTAGTLACVRVGAKRERRFRREDLFAFLQSDGPSGQSPNRRHHCPPILRRVLLRREGNPS